MVHGLGNVNSTRDTGLGIANASYNGRIDGALTELSHCFNIDQRAALEYLRASTGSFDEQGGFDPLTASGASAERSTHQGTLGLEFKC